MKTARRNAVLSVSLERALKAGLWRQDFAGAVVHVQRAGLVMAELAMGHRHRYRRDPSLGQVIELSAPLKMGADVAFDLASLTKLVTTLGVLVEVSAGRLELNRPVVPILRPLAQGATARLTARQLLQHRSGLAAWLPGCLAATLPACQGTRPGNRRHPGRGQSGASGRRTPVQ